jgi:hypothetical protein
MWTGNLRPHSFSALEKGTRVASSLAEVIFMPDDAKKRGSADRKRTNKQGNEEGDQKQKGQEKTAKKK